MKSIRVIVMGKTGVGKSTLINAVLGKNVAKNGDGKPITTENEYCSGIIDYPVKKANEQGFIYEKTELILYDTVGLELNENTNEKTLCFIREEMKKEEEKNNINIVWFCVEETKKRFEDFEIQLIRKLSIEYEIPFLIVLTKCTSKKRGEFERKIEEIAPEIMIQRVLAEKFEIDEGIEIGSHGIEEMLYLTYSEYNQCKVKLLQEKINKLDEKRQARIEKIESSGKSLIESYVKKGGKCALLPGICVPKIHALCIKLIGELNKVAGVKVEKEFNDDIFADVILGIVMTPLMVVPFISSPVAEGYIETVGNGYLNGILSVLNKSSDEELNNCKLVKERLVEEIKKIS